MASISIRPYVPTDHAYIMSAMRTTLTKTPTMRGVHPALMDSLINPIVALFTTLVATPSDDDNTILGYLIYSLPNTVGFLFVRQSLRHKGIGKALLARAGLNKGEILTPFMATAPLAGLSFPRFAESKGYTLRHRPYIPLQLSAEILIPSGETKSN